MKFFVPGEEDAEAAAAWDQMRASCGAPEGTRPIFSLSYEDDGTEVAVTVGEEGVIAILFGGESVYVFGESGESRPVPVGSVTEMVYFDD